MGLCAALLTASAAFAETPGNGVVTIASGDRTHSFAIEIADEPNERSVGLMNRPFMAEDAGMLFIYPREQFASFWMKNTLIPLDMLFISNDGRILQVAREAVPLSLTPIRSTQKVRAVLEINGGLAERLGIDVGDTVTLYREK